MKIGYARVSTKDQKLERQVEALGKIGCTKIFQETKSVVKERPELEKMLELTGLYIKLLPLSAEREREMNHSTNSLTFNSLLSPHGVWFLKGLFQSFLKNLLALKATKNLNERLIYVCSLRCASSYPLKLKGTTASTCMNNLTLTFTKLKTSKT